MAPLIAWMEARGIFCSRVVRQAFANRGRAITRSHANQIKAGLAPAPEWLIEECCAVLCVPVSLIYPDAATAAHGPLDPHSQSAQQASGSSEWSVA